MLYCPKQQSFGWPVVGSSFKTGKDCLFGFLGTVQQFYPPPPKKKKNGFLGQYSVSVNCPSEVRRGADAQLLLMMFVKVVYECSQPKRILH